jgi:hypothetical protein
MHRIEETVKLNRVREGATLGQAQVEEPGVKFTCMEGLKNSPLDGVNTVQAPTISSRAEVGVLNRNIAGSVRLVS